jgi:uncharacterized NAD-dependent epimerase/dehydratase family protein
LGVGIPVVRDIHAALELHPEALLIGIAAAGGELPEEWHGQLLTAIAAGLDIISGLHTFLADDAQLSEAARQHGVRLWDVRRPAPSNRVAQFIPHRPGSHTVLFVGSDCAVGKMTVALELNREAKQRGLNSAFLATGQTGIMIANDGLPVDHILSDFEAGMVEEKVLDYTNAHDWVFVEGQGALNHPGYSPVTLGLIHGSMPDLMIFCHKAGATTIDGYPNNPLPSLKRLIQMNEEAVRWLNEKSTSKVVGISLMTPGMTEQEAWDEVKRVADETGLPTTDALRFGVNNLLDALLA